MAHPLDQPDTYARLDPSGMWRRLRALADQCRDAYAQVQRLPLPGSGPPVTSVLVTGMGGSAVGGDLVADLLAAQGCPLRVSSWRDYGVPPWVRPGVLVIACSCSGATEETLSAFKAALSQGASVVAITGGGELARLANQHQALTIPVPYRGEPRTALGYTFLAPLALLARLGLAPDPTPDLEGACHLLEGLAERHGPSTPESGNPAKELARRLLGREPSVYSGRPLSAVACLWKAAFNENAKTWAEAEQLPELHHNSVVGYQFPAGIGARHFVLLLRSSYLAPALLRRYALTTELLQKAGIPHQVVDAEGASRLEHMLGLIYLGMWTSYYLGLLYGVDPSATQSIDNLKRQLAPG